MNSLRLISIVSMLALAPAAFAGNMPKGEITGYFTMEELEAADGNGFGLRGWATVSGPWFINGEYQTASLDTGGPSFDVNQLRFGGGYAGELQKGAMWLVRGEYISIGGDINPKQGGLGVHGGAMFMPSEQFGLFGTLGYLTTDDTDGLELNFGGSFNFTREWALAIDYRTYMGSVDPAGDFELTDLRVGASYSFY